MNNRQRTKLSQLATDLEMKSNYFTGTLLEDASDAINLLLNENELLERKLNDQRKAKTNNRQIPQ